MRRIRVCQLITELRLSGAERMVYELAWRLDRERFDVQVAALRGGEVGEMLAAKGIAVHVLGVRGKWDMLKVRALAGMLREQRIDLLHTHLFHADLAGRPAAIVADVPHVVHTVHVAEQRFRPWQYMYARLLAGRCERIVCVSASVRDHHAAHSHLPLDRYVVIPNGVDAAAFAPDGEARKRLRGQWGIAPRQVAVLFLGRLDHQKGLDVLLEAIGRMKTTPDVRFVIAGDGPQRGMVEEHLLRGSQAMNCRYVGFVHDVRAALSACDMFVLPSRWEGWPVALAEAMAAGLPCVATNVPGTRDVVRDGLTGILVPSQDADALAEALADLAGREDRRRQLGQAAHEDITQHFSIDRNVRAHQELYTQLSQFRK